MKTKTIFIGFTIYGLMAVTCLQAGKLVQVKGSERGSLSTGDSPTLALMSSFRSTSLTGRIIPSK
jgi:hypothetical protein